MWCSPSSVMSSQRCSPKRIFTPLPFAMCSSIRRRHDVARRELLLLGLVVGHEAVPVDVLQQAAVAAAALGDEDAGRKDAGRMELHRLHVAERRDAGLERDRVPDAFADHRVGRHRYSRPAPPVAIAVALATYADSSPVTRSRTTAP